MRIGACGQRTLRAGSCAVMTGPEATEEISRRNSGRGTLGSSTPAMYRRNRIESASATAFPSQGGRAICLGHSARQLSGRELRAPTTHNFRPGCVRRPTGIEGRHKLRGGNARRQVASPQHPGRPNTITQTGPPDAAARATPNSVARGDRTFLRCGAEVIHASSAAACVCCP